jgi:hypothetical protein
MKQIFNVLTNEIISIYQICFKNRRSKNHIRKKSNAEEDGQKNVLNGRIRVLHCRSPNLFQISKMAWGCLRSFSSSGKKFSDRFRAVD